MSDKLKIKGVGLATGYAKDDQLISIRPASRGVVGWERRSHSFLHKQRYLKIQIFHFNSTCSVE